MKYIYIVQNIFCLFLLGAFVYSNSANEQMLYNGNIEKVRILSYNIRNARGTDDIVDYDRVAGVINRVAANCVAIQELDSATRRSNGDIVLDEIARRTRMYAVFNSSIKYDGGKYGIGILTKEKPIRKEAISLPGREEERSLLLVEMNDYVICCTHWSLSREDRMASVELVNELVAKYTDKPVFLAGDLNAEPKDQEIQKLKLTWQILNNEKEYTYPSINPTKCIDYIMIKKNFPYPYQVLQSKVECEPLASDHSPIWIEIVFDK
ncbi:endonuclease/exonuclease/phosphatase family protein [Tannerella forsythia]|uniref:Metallophosphoesterase n=1 Tax=Tannerella forsythia TaxID=28112 RepID=A0A3P1XWU0_TANFO|nr:endonuclease/exonuclease/phosphatase family protein [Tannerella forsythia]RRD62448.1 metallophosphoesterase [Tannerella forsythia]